MPASDWAALKGMRVYDALEGTLMVKTSDEVVRAISEYYYGKYIPIENRFSTRVPATIYHYTNVSSLISIIENKSLWASRAEYLNDANEYRYGLNICKEELTAVAKAGDKYKAFADKVTLAMSSTSNSPFVACFCQNGDLLSQWRGYSAHGQGLSIGFISKSFSQLDHVRTRNIIYDRAAQADFSFTAY